MKTKTMKKETGTLTIESFLKSINIADSEPIRVECGITDDYSIFKPFFANRPLNKKRSEIIGRDMVKHGNFSSVQCVRSEDCKSLLVWDGQHVLAAAISAGKHVNYDIYDRVPKDILMLKNRNTKQWTLDNFHAHQIDRGSRIAKTVQSFMDLSRRQLGRSIKLTATLRLLSGCYSNQEYKNGTFEIKVADNAHKILGCLKDFAEYIDFVADSKFASSFQMVFNCGLYDHSVMMKRIPKNYKLLHSQLKVIDVVTGIEDCYNSRSRSKYVDFVSACGLKK